ncbi:MAG: NAD-dependent succinate-semialdehyde dehydrogenase [Gammaproteobacteria bacterium]|nr:MAG: NAD-dependent succinate-semialdehyde dehydrogenase [Gammaproteobacteria bacterium]
MESVDPATGGVVCRYPALSDQEVEQRVAQGHEQAVHWSEVAVERRCELLASLAEALTSQRDGLAELMGREMGKLRREALAEVDKCAWVCRYYAEQAPVMLADQLVDTEASRSLVIHQPLGLLLAVMPWNFPLWQVFRAAVPAIAAGNTVLLKHASSVTGCALAIADLFAAVDAPTGLFGVLAVPASRIADVIADRRVRSVTLTGSDAAGRAVAATAGRALKKTVLELGGSDPFIVLEDADLDRTLEKAVQSRFMNCGQSCIAAKRFIVVEAVASRFLSGLVNRVSALRVGPPDDPASDIGPMARADLRSELHGQVRDALDKGAECLAGGQVIEGPGCYYQPTVLTGITPAMRAYREELFGPVATVYRVPDEATALELANDSDFGLGGSVWTADRQRGEALARRLACGCAFVNELVKSDPRLPFGGVKDSGYGRELSVLGIHEFVNHKTVWID